jgi:hypothetical protein
VGVPGFVSGRRAAEFQGPEGAHSEWATLVPTGVIWKF